MKIEVRRGGTRSCAPEVRILILQMAFSVSQFFNGELFNG